MNLFTTYGTNDLSRAIRFYDAIFSVLEQPRLPGWSSGWAGWGKNAGQGTGFWICQPFDAKPASVGNGTMIAFPAKSADQVRQFHAAGINNGGMNEGVPGIRNRYKPDFYVAYLRDPDGNKLSCFYFHYDSEMDEGG
ncbi:VOC family protein [Ruegeria arenilitoris]|uniref:VOC family protein n=1 Tax=Ruegeria arenilitoris TaxID=1173585 RepID=UPI00147F93A1|nr:VOC family protein [Ruegeria arenilitoris]